MKLTTPLQPEDIESLNIGDKLELSGTVVTARDEAHKHLVNSSPEVFPIDLKGAVIYHCGPVLKDGKIIAAGPTTSIREEPYEADVIRAYGVAGIIGKGGMGSRTLDSFRKNKAAYFAAVGGAAVVIADSIKKIREVHMLEEFGAPEAFWVLEVEEMPLIVGMDCHGKSLYNMVEASSKVKLDELLKK